MNPGRIFSRPVYGPVAFGENKALCGEMLPRRAYYFWMRREKNER